MTRRKRTWESKSAITGMCLRQTDISLWHASRYIEPPLAKQLAEGDVCPITLLPMEDINPTFVPRALKPIPTNTTSSYVTNYTVKGKAKARMGVASEKPQNSSLLNFFSVYLLLLVSIMAWFATC